MIVPLICLSALFSDASAGDPKVLLVGIDGFRSEAYDAAALPNLRALAAEGCLTLEARTDEHAISGAGWSNLLTGVWSDKHGSTDNEFQATRYSEFPSVFARLAKAAPALRCGAFTDWKPLDEKILGKTPFAKRFFHDYQDGGDAKAVAAARSSLATDDLDFVFVYLADVDVAGHAHGFHSAVPEYLAALETADAQVGELLEGIRARPALAAEDWLVLVVSDHGGTLDRRHGRDCDAHRRSPLIVSGRSAARGRIVRPVSQVDVVPTVLAHLRVAVDPAWRLDGRAVGLARERPQLGDNLIENGGAEANGGVESAQQNVAIAAFVDEGATTAVRYGAPGGFPGAATPGPAPKRRGERFFAGGAVGAAGGSAIEQAIDLAPFAPLIDAGRCGFRLAGWLGGFAEQRDLARLAVAFERDDGDLLATAAIGPVTLEERRSAFIDSAPQSGGLSGSDARGDAFTSLLERKAEGLVPRGARRAVVRLETEAGDGACDGYADELSLVLVEHAEAADAAEVEAVVNRILVADNAGDLESILDCYTDDVVLLPPNAKPLQGRELVRERYRAILEASRLDLYARIDETRVDGEIAYCRGVTLGETKPKDGSPIRPVQDNFVMVLRRDARGAWKIARLMWHPQGP